MRRAGRTTTAGALIALGVGLSGCDAILEQGAEETAERAIEGAASEDVDVDLGDEGVKIDGEDGEFSAGGGAELPDSWPDDIPMPESYEVMSSMRSNGELHASLLTAEDVDAFAERVQSELVGAGYELENEQVTDMGDGKAYTYGAVSGDTGVQVMIGARRDDTVVNYLVNTELER